MLQDFSDSAAIRLMLGIYTTWDLLGKFVALSQVK